MLAAKIKNCAFKRYSFIFSINRSGDGFSGNRGSALPVMVVAPTIQHGSSAQARVTFSTPDGVTANVKPGVARNFVVMSAHSVQGAALPGAQDPRAKMQVPSPVIDDVQDDPDISGLTDEERSEDFEGEFSFQVWFHFIVVSFFSLIFIAQEISYVGRTHFELFGKY